MNRSMLAALSVLVAIFMLASCVRTGEQAGAGDHGDAHWSYEGSTGPENWGRLSRAYRPCAAGKSQSPINIVETTESQSLQELIVGYEPFSPTVVINNGHTVRVNVPTTGTLTFEGTPYRLLQYHFHNPSEHAINGELSDMELHLVHQSEAGDLLVVGVMLEAGEAENPVLARFWDAMPTEEGEEEVSTTVDIANILPSDGMYYTYEGSLTTPPCSEGVRWIVMKTPVEISQEQSDAYAAFLGETNRPLQALNGRTVEVKKFGFVRE